MGGEDWRGTGLQGDASDPKWWNGVPDVYGNIDGMCVDERGQRRNCAGWGVTDVDGAERNPRSTNYLMALWCWRLVKAYDRESTPPSISLPALSCLIVDASTVLEFCRERIYDPLLTNGQKWELADSYEDNMGRMNDWCPGTDLNGTTEIDWVRATIPRGTTMLRSRAGSPVGCRRLRCLQCQRCAGAISFLRCTKPKRCCARARRTHCRRTRSISRIRPGPSATSLRSRAATGSRVAWRLCAWSRQRGCGRNNSRELPPRRRPKRQRQRRRRRASARPRDHGGPARAPARRDGRNSSRRNEATKP